MEIKECTGLALLWLATTNGTLVSPKVPAGLDVFTPIQGTQGQDMVQFVGKGAVLKTYSPEIHMLSVRSGRRVGTNWDRIGCVSMTSIGDNRAAWWSVPMLQLPDQDSMEEAIKALVNEDPDVEKRIVRVKELQAACEQAVNTKDRKYADPARITLRLLKELREAKKNADREIPSMQSNLPPKFDLDTSFILYAASCTPAEAATGYYTNLRSTARQGNRGGFRPQQQQQNSEPAI